MQECWLAAGRLATGPQGRPASRTLRRPRLCALSVSWRFLHGASACVDLTMFGATKIFTRWCTAAERSWTVQVRAWQEQGEPVVVKVNRSGQCRLESLLAAHRMEAKIERVQGG